MSTVVSFRVDKELKKKMEELSYINWSEVVRRAIAKVVEEESSKKTVKDFVRIRKASIRCKILSRKVEGWSSVEEVRRWRGEFTS
ncbi:MAG: hypothetical protein AYL29_012030 [Candidatus Bathyarchaeota archaeon B24]|nr:MAG: hypothetical protein AYL29_012030 [Candidatus Bathyarchaeota archaeon B24]RLI25151.1 MAG: VapB-type antitoxin [Candidatus Bathyarchaeota archaeon]